MILRPGKPQLTLVLLTTILLTGSLLYSQSSPPTTGPSTQNSDTEQTLDQLIPELGAPDFTLRQAAAHEIGKLGGDSLPALRHHLSQEPDTEIHARLTTLIQQIETQDALKPTLVTLDVDHLPLRETIAELSRQSGFPIDMSPDNDSGGLKQYPPVTLHVVKQPLLKVLQQIAEQSPIEPLRAGDNNGGMSILLGSHLPPRIYATDTCLVTLYAIYHSSDIKLTDEPGTEQINKYFYLTFKIYADPKLQIVEEPFETHLTTAIDNQGNNLLPTSKTNQSFTRKPPTGHHIFASTANLSYPVHPGTLIKKLRGEIHVVAQTQSSSVQFENLNQPNQIQNMNGVKITLETFKTQTPNYWTAKLHFRRDGISPENFQKLFPTNSASSLQLKLLDNNHGLITVSKIISGVGQANTEYAYEYGFYRHSENPQKARFTPSTLRISYTTKQEDLTIPFEFKDIPMP